MANLKIQNFGLNKKVVADQFRFVMMNGLDKQELSTIEEELVSALTEVSLYGWGEITNKNYSDSVVRMLNTSFGDIRKIDDITLRYSNERSFVIKEVTKRFTQLDYVIRQEFVETTPEERDFEKEISNFEKFLLNYYEDTLLPFLESSEKEIREELQKIFASDLPENEKVTKAEDFLEETEKKLADKYTKEYENMSEVAIETALAIISIVSLPEPTNKNVEAYKSIFKKGYLSNIKGNLFTWFRQTDELFTDIITLRSKERDLIQKISMNKNNFKLSVISHIRGLVRAISNKQAIEQGIDSFKAIVPQWVVPTLEPNGVTAKYLYLIKSREEWKNLSEATTSNVVDGLSLHYNDQMYYLPIKNIDIQEEISKKQRKNLISYLNDN